MVVVALTLLEEPITVMFTVPGAALLLAVKVKVLQIAVVTGLNEAVTPLGSDPEIERLTLPEKPLVGTTVIVVWPLPPCGTVTCDPESANVGERGWFAEDTPLQPLVIKDNKSPAATARRNRHAAENMKRLTPANVLAPETITPRRSVRGYRRAAATAPSRRHYLNTLAEIGSQVKTLDHPVYL